MGRLLLLLLLLGGGAALYFKADPGSGPDQEASDSSEAPEFIKGAFVTFATHTIREQNLVEVTGLPEGFGLKAVPDRKGERISGVKLLLTHGALNADQIAHAHATGQDLLLILDTGTVRVKVIEWLGYSHEDQSALGVTLQFDFKYPKYPKG